jgi:hypothetical protein
VTELNCWKWQWERGRSGAIRRCSRAFQTAKTDTWTELGHESRAFALNAAGSKREDRYRLYNSRAHVADA